MLLVSFCCCNAFVGGNQEPQGLHTPHQQYPLSMLCFTSNNTPCVYLFCTRINTPGLYTSVPTGPLVSDRDFLVEQTRLQLPCGTYVVHTVSTQDQQHDANDTSKSPKTLQNNLPMVAPARRKGCVRAMLGDCGWVVRPIDAHTCHVTYVAQVDPKVCLGGGIDGVLGLRQHVLLVGQRAVSRFVVWPFISCIQANPMGCKCTPAHTLTAHT